MQNEYIEIATSLFKATKEVLLAGAGGVVAYMYDYTRLSKDNPDYKWSSKSMIINMCVGSFVGYTVGSFIPIDFAYRDGMIGFSGVSAYTIIGLIESKFAAMLIEKITGTRMDINNGNSK